MKKRRGQTYTKEEREQILSKYKLSGMGLSRWCREQGYNKGTLRTWLKRYGSADIAKEDKRSLGFASVEVATISEGSLPLQIHYPNGVQLHLDSQIDLGFLSRLIYLEKNV